MSRIAWATGCVAIGLVLYGSRLRAPRPHPQEILLAGAAEQLADSGGRDTAGRFLPVLVQAAPEEWLAPLPVYAAAGLRKAVSQDSANIRWLAVGMGCVSLVLMFVFGVVMFDSRHYGALAALLLLFTPAQFIYSRSAQFDGIWLIPFFLLWLIGIASFLARPAAGMSMLGLAIAAIAAAAYTQPSAMAISIALAVMTLIAIGRSGTPLARCWPAAAAGVVVITPLLVWLTLHYRAAYPDTYGRWLLHEVNLRHPTEWAQSFTNRQMLATCSGAFWDFFSPTNLAMNADGPGFVGVLSLPIVILAGTGIYAARRPFGSDSMRVVSECIVIGPLVAAILRDSRAAQRALIIAPVTASLAAFGAAALLTSRHSFVRWFAIAMLVAVVVQFAAAYQGLVSASSVAWVQSPR